MVVVDTAAPEQHEGLRRSPLFAVNTPVSSRLAQAATPSQLTSGHRRLPEVASLFQKAERTTPVMPAAPPPSLVQLPTIVLPTITATKEGLPPEGGRFNVPSKEGFASSSPTRSACHQRYRQMYGCRACSKA